MRNIFTSKSQILIALVGIIGLILVFILVARQPFQEPTVSEPPQEEISQIDQTVKNNLSENFNPTDLVLVNHKASGDWAASLVYSTAEDIDAGIVILQKVDGQWKVAYGPASDYDTSELMSMGVPQALIEQLDSIFIPPGQ